MATRSGPNPLDVALLSTGGTIEKTYDPLHGVLRNDVSVLDVLLSELHLEGVTLHRHEVMNKDSLDLTTEDHDLIVQSVREACLTHNGVIVVHGTDRLPVTGEAIAADWTPPVPVVLTGAMTPWILRTTDAKQNLTEALMAVQLLAPGTYVCMHNRVIDFPGVVKDRHNLRFVRSTELQHEDVR